VTRRKKTRSPKPDTGPGLSQTLWDQIEKLAQHLQPTYEALVKNGKASVNLTIAHCWAHVRRKFIEAEDAYPELSEPAIAMIKDLYKIEKKLPRITPDTPEDERGERLELRHRIRQQDSRPKIDEIRKTDSDFLFPASFTLSGPETLEGRWGPISRLTVRSRAVRGGTRQEGAPEPVPEALGEAAWRRRHAASPRAS